jgi:FOG: HEAT repeat
MDKPTRQERQRQRQRRIHVVFYFLAPLLFVLHFVLDALLAESEWKGFLVAATTALALAAFAYYLFAYSLRVLKGRRDLPDWVNWLVDKAKIGEAWEQVKASGQRAVPPLRQILRFPDLVNFVDVSDFDVMMARQSAALLLGRLKAKEAIPELLDALGDLDRDLCAAALWALGEIGETQTVPNLVLLLGDWRWATVKWMDEPPERQKKANGFVTGRRKR